MLVRLYLGGCNQNPFDLNLINQYRSIYMQYLLMIYAAEDAGPQPGTDEFIQMLGGYQN